MIAGQSQSAAATPAAAAAVAADDEDDMSNSDDDDEMDFFGCVHACCCVSCLKSLASWASSAFVGEKKPSAAVTTEADNLAACP